MATTASPGGDNTLQFMSGKNAKIHKNTQQQKFVFFRITHCLGDKTMIKFTNTINSKNTKSAASNRLELVPALEILQNLNTGSTM